jgi:phosphate transport system substrate-binding protein
VALGASAGAWEVSRDPRGLSPAGWRDTPLAFDALVPAVSVENAVTGLTLLGVRAALAGEFPDWVGLGGGEAPVSIHWSEVLDGPLTERYGLSRGASATLHDDIADVADAVARSGGGLGLLPLSEIGSAVPLVLTGPCGRGSIGVPPAIRSGDYPLSQAVILRRPPGRPAPVARAFLDWLETPAAGAAVRHAGFVDLAVGVVSPGRDGRQGGGPPSPATPGSDGRAAMDAGLGRAPRLDVAVRFEDGSSVPDRAARIQIRRLARSIASGQFDGRRLLLVGFSDANGAAATNLALSRRRAEAIRDAVLAEAGQDAERVTIEARGFGEAVPVACNGVAWGERLNRRVEVWLAPEGR